MVFDEVVGYCNLCDDSCEVCENCGRKFEDKQKIICVSTEDADEIWHFCSLLCANRRKLKYPKNKTTFHQRLI